ncbi:MAG TPA: hypothetical protein VL096_03150 [Pirellulaceae bacterium]|nr:hypothetical protein [Pirellulaceae bacterium]
MMRYLSILVLAAMLGVSSGCALLPDITHEPQFHNPFPQLYRVAVLPFGNQSKEPTVDGEAVALAYYNELQVIRGFEVMPVPVVKRLLEASKFQPNGPGDFQKLARFMGVDAVVVGSITEYTPYYPPRMGLAVNWYAANPNFHPIPAGYGLPWGTTQEQDIPEDLVFEAEFALARRQLETQTPEIVAPLPATHPASHTAPLKDAAKTAKNAEKSGSNAAIKAARLDELPTPAMLPRGASAVTAGGDVIAPLPGEVALPPALPELPADWPDPRGFIPPPPSLTRPEGTPQTEPVITHTRVYHGSDPDFTNKLEKYYYYRDDARFGGWQSYLQRSDDFTRFCCHLHITEMLAARGGVGKPRVVYRWPISRYER